MKKRNSLVYITFNLFIGIIIFEILFRGLEPSIGPVLNIIKIIIPLVLLFLATTVLEKKPFSSTEKSFIIFFIVFYIIFFIKVITLFDFQALSTWLQEDNNMNYLYVFIFYLSIRKLDMDIYLSENFLKFYNFIVLALSAYGFFKHEFFGTVTSETILNYAWVGTDKVRVMSIFGNPNHAGLYFVLMLFILDSFRIKGNKSFFNISNVLLCIFNVLTFSRTSIVIMLIYLIIRNKIMNVNVKNNKFLKILKKFRFIIIIIILFVIGIFLINKYNIYFFSSEYLETTRIDKWQIGIKYMLNNFILGTPFNIPMIGYTEKYGLLAFSDNFFIELGAQFGLIIFLYCIVFVINKLILSIKQKNFFTFNKIQLFIISSLLSGTIHFSVPMFLFIIYILLNHRQLS